VPRRVSLALLRFDYSDPGEKYSPY
jgi:hypothetical protein